MVAYLLGTLLAKILIFKAISILNCKNKIKKLTNRIYSCCLIVEGPKKCFRAHLAYYFFIKDYYKSF